ncbi:MAG: glycosyltransferase family 39 protein [Coriobacteriales bacterium]|jgi:uncharacterized membrane protein
MKRRFLPQETTRRYDVIYHAGVGLLMVVVGIYLVYLGATTSLWLDDIFQVEYCRSTTFAQILLIDPLTPPLFNVFVWCWYRIVPYGEIWLRLPSIAFVLACLPLIAATGRRMGGRRTGFLSAFLLAINAKVLSQMALSFRAYALLLFLSTLLIYLYVRRVQTPKDEVSWKLSIGTGLAMLALGYTHYFGVVLCCAFFIIDLYLVVRRRLDGIRAKVFVPYAIALVGYIPWAVVAAGALTHTVNATATSAASTRWHEASSNLTVHGLLYWLCGECAETLGFFHVAAIIVLVVAVYRCVRRTFDWRSEMPVLALVVITIVFIAGMWAYTHLVNTSSTLWVERYFTPLVPCIALATGWGIAKIFSWIPTTDPVRFIAAFLCVVLLVPTTLGTVHNDLSEGSSTRFYAHLTEYLESRSDISSDKTCVLALIDTTGRGQQIEGWKHYYFNRKDTRDFKVTIWDGLDPSVIVNPEDLLQFDTIYVTRQHFDPQLPKTYERLFREHYKKHSTTNPGWGETTYYTRID